MKTKTEEPRYPTDSLLNSKLLAGYQSDFARALLTKESYTVSEALAVLDHFYKEGN